MIKPKKSARELWNQLGLRNHIKQTFEEKETTWGQIVDSNKKNLSQRSISEYTLTQRLNEQRTSFIKNKEKPNTKTFLEDQIEKGVQEREEWQQLALVNEKSQISPSPNRNRNSNDQTFSPINRLRNDEQQQSLIQTNQQLNTCKLQGHENNQFKFICLDNDCPYKLQKACAHCVIKLHTKHVAQMKEIESYELLIDQNLKKAEDLMDKSQLVLKVIQKPYDEYFQQIKNQIINQINELQQKFQQLNKDHVQSIIASEIETIQNYNSKFEAYKLMNSLIPDNMIDDYEKLMNSIMQKTKLTINLEPLNKQINRFITDLFCPKQQKENKEFSDETEILQQLVSSTRDMNKESVVKHSTITSQSLHSPPTNKKVLQTKLVMGQASPLNVFNRQIQGRQVTKIIQAQPPIVYYRTNN